MVETTDNPSSADPLVETFLSQDEPAGAMTERVLIESLHAIRTHLGMEVAFISEFDGERRTFRFLDEDEGAPRLQVGASNLREESYCQRVVDGRLPELIPDACENAEALTLPATREIPIGAHLSVPIRLQDGSVYGTLCCFDRQPDASLNERDQGMMRVFADFAARQLEGQLSASSVRRSLRKGSSMCSTTAGFTSSSSPCTTSPTFASPVTKR